MAHREGPGALVKLAALVGVLAPVLVLIGAAGTRFGLMDWQVGFRDFALKYAQWAAYAGLVLAVLATVLSLRRLRTAWPLLLLAFLAPGLVLAGLLKLRADARAAPPIHDVATDWEEPLGFSADLMAERADAPNKIEADPRVPTETGPPWGGRRVAEINAETCPGARTAPNTDPDAVAAAFEKAGVQVRGRAAWRVEGTAESFWFGFKDDVVARIRPGEGTDIRSVSRVGRSDLGANCARVTKIVEALQRPSPAG